jgi:hypothetical protein
LFFSFFLNSPVAARGAQGGGCRATGLRRAPRRRGPRCRCRRGGCRPLEGCRCRGSRALERRPRGAPGARSAAPASPPRAPPPPRARRRRRSSRRRRRASREPPGGPARSQKLPQAGQSAKGGPGGRCSCAQPQGRRARRRGRGGPSGGRRRRRGSSPRWRLHRALEFAPAHEATRAHSNKHLGGKSVK